MSRRSAAVLALVALYGGCKRPAPASDAPPEQASAPIAAAPDPTPVDHLAPGELLEGPVRAFGLPLPRATAVKGAFVDVTYASGPVSVHALAQYFRTRLRGGRLHERVDEATFEHATVPGNPGVELRVHILAAADGSTVEIRDSTPPAAPSLPDEPSRWRQVGLTPQGRLADPTHLE